MITVTVYNHNAAANDTYDCDDNYDKKQQAVYNDDKPAGKYNNNTVMLEMTMLVIMLAQHTDHRRPRRCKKMSPTQSVVLKSHASAGLLPASDKSSPKSPQGH